MKLKEYFAKVMSDFRCSECNRLLFKGKLQGNYHLEIACSRCKNINVFERKIIDKNLQKNK